MGSKNWIFERNIYKALENSDAAIVLTEWFEYSQLDWKKIALLMRPPSWVFDSRGILNKNELSEANLKFWILGDSEN